VRREHNPVAIHDIHGNNDVFSTRTAMQQKFIRVTDFAETGSQQPMASDRRSGAALHRVAGAFHNLPSSSEKLTDSTLPLTWPAPYLDQLTSDEAAWSRENVAAVTDNAAVTPLSENYAQLMRKLQAESVAAQGKPQVDKALCIAHYISTLIAALAFIAMMAIIVVTCFPTLLP
jgi:hypothetical protein